MNQYRKMIKIYNYYYIIRFVDYDLWRIYLILINNTNKRKQKEKYIIEHSKGK